MMDICRKLNNNKYYMFNNECRQEGKNLLMVDIESVYRKE
jgi:hypothetical protein